MSMKYLTSFLAFIAFLSFLLPVAVLGASYPASCPTEAQAIVDAVGGCPAIDPGQYSSIYEKCCSISETPASEPSLEPTPEPSPDSDQETPSDTVSIIVSTLILGGLGYSVMRFVLKRKKERSSAPTMLEKKCPYCKGVIPGDATRCSHCQADLRNWLRRHPIWTVIITLLIVLFTVGLGSQ